jgi:hypothetical protein
MKPWMPACTAGLLILHAHEQQKGSSAVAECEYVIACLPCAVLLRHLFFPFSLFFGGFFTSPSLPHSLPHVSHTPSLSLSLGNGVGVELEDGSRLIRDHQRRRKASRNLLRPNPQATAQRAVAVLAIAAEAHAIVH